MTHYLDEHDWWTDNTGKRHSINDMKADYAQNIFNLLVRKASGVAAEYSVYLATTPMPNGDIAFDSVERAIDGEAAAMADDPYAWLVGKPLMQALKWRMDVQPLSAVCWCRHAASDHIKGGDDPRPLCIGCTTRPIGTREVPTESFHRMADVRPSDDELEANRHCVPYDDEYRATLARNRAKVAAAIREETNKETGLPYNDVLDNPIREFVPVAAQEGDEYRVFVVTTGYYSDYSIDSTWVGDRNSAHRRKYFLELKSRDAEVHEFPNLADCRTDNVKAVEDPEVLIARYRTRINLDNGSVIDQSADTTTRRQSDVEPTHTTVEQRDPVVATRAGWRHEVEVTTMGPVTDLERIRKSHSERVAFVRAAVIEGNPFRD